MNKKAPILIYMVLFSVLTACGKQGNDDPSVKNVSKVQLAAKVDNMPISQALFDDFKNQYGWEKGRKISDKELLDKLIQMELLAREARLRELEKTQEAKTKFMLLEKQFMADRALENFDIIHPVTMEDLKSEYHKRFVESNVEYKVLQIVVPTEENAKSIIENALLGANFGKLSDLEGNKGHNDLGWVQSHQLQPEFAEVIASLEDGKVAPQPIAVDNGWAVLYREDSRKLATPEFEDVKIVLHEYLRKERRKNHVKALITSAEIQIFENDTSLETHPKEKLNSVEEAEQLKNPEKALELEGEGKEAGPKTDQEMMHTIKDSQL